MGPLEEKIDGDLKKAIKERNNNKITALRMLKAAIENLSIEKKRAELNDEDIIKVVRGQIRKYKDSIEQFTKGGRTDLVEKEKSELSTLESYMPAELSTEELQKMAREAISETGATSKKDMGKVMKVMMEKAKGRADGKTVSQVISDLLK